MIKNCIDDKVNDIVDNTLKLYGDSSIDRPIRDPQPGVNINLILLNKYINTLTWTNMPVGNLSL